MKTDSEWSPGPGVKVSSTNRTDGGWIVSAVIAGDARCPACGARSNRRHGWCVRHLQDLPAQGATVKLMLRVARWRCLNPACVQMTFGDRLPQIVALIAAGQVVWSTWLVCLPTLPEAGQPAA
jgi:transposase